MNKTKYLWYIPALYVAYMFGNKITEGLQHSQEFIDIISFIAPLKPIAYSITPLVGIFDFCISISLLLNPVITKNTTIQKFLFIWVILWPFIPSSLRYFGGVAEFEIIEVLSISISACISFLLWKKYAENK